VLRLAGIFGHGEPSANTYRSVEYARVFLAQLTICDAITWMGTEVTEGLAQSS
jgi:hypothetical protein